MPISVRDIDARDRDAWLGLWHGYLVFYETDLAPAVTENTWRRLVDPDGDLIGLVAVDEADWPVGFAVCVVHGGTWSPKPVCYLEDLFVDPKARGGGVGRNLIEALAARGRREGWLRLYWQTAAGNARAQALYDKLARRTDWVRYELDL